MSDYKIRLLGFLAAVLTFGAAGTLTFLIAFNSFWWCPEGGCALSSWTSKLHLLANVAGVIALGILFTLLFLFVFVLLVRPFVSRTTIEAMLFEVEIPLLGWYDRLMHRWVRLLWNRHAA